MKRKTWKAVRGSVTLLLVLILLPMMTFSAVIVDTSRINMARSMVSSAGDLAMNTALANYDTILKDVYGLFAMSQGKTDAEMAEDIKKYFQETLVSYGVVNEAQSGEYVEALIGDFTEIVGGVSEVNVQNLMEMKVGDDFSVARQADSALSNPDVLRKQIVEYMKYRAPINLGMSFLDSLKAFKSVEKQNEVVETQVKAQESTQDVTSQCKKLIKLIREFDKLIESIEEGDKLVKGSAYSTDGVAVQIADYPGQVDKYARTWGQENNKENYAHTNLINLVFLAKAPSSNVYLKNLGAAKFIGSDASGNYYVVLENTGISGVTASGLGLDEAEAKTQMQINALNCTNSEPYRAQMESYASFGISLDVLDPTSNYTALKYFVDEPAAIDYYNQYVGFLQNINQNVKYSEIQTALQQILILGQYFKQYETLIDQEINSSYQLYDAAKQHMENLNRQGMSNAQNIYNAARDIDNLMQGFVDSDAYEEISSVPAEAFDALYGYYDLINPSLQNDYTGHYDHNYKRSSSDTEDIFVRALKGIGNNSAYEGKAGDIASAVKSYYSSGQSGSLLTYVTNKVKNASEEPVYALVRALYQAHQKAEEVPGYISAYNQAVSQLPAAIQDYENKKATYEGWVARKAGVVQQMNSCLSWYKPYVDVYQEDVIIYDKYMQTAQNIVTRETSAINTQFTKIKNNINEIIQKLTAIETQIGEAEKAITIYDGNVNKWEEANNKYENSNKKDSFSKQNASDIAASREQYDKESLALLLASVQAVKKAYNDFYTLLTDATHYKYGTAKIDTLSEYTGTKSAVSTMAAQWTELVLSAEFANGKFESLYNTEATPALEPDFSYFLRPVRPIQILKYLNETYPEEETLTEEQKTKNEETKAEYEEAKGELTGESASISDDTPAGKYGYSYKGKSIAKAGMPSAEHAASGSDGKEYKASVDENDPDKVDTSSGMNEQKSALSGVLSGIEKVLSTGVENLYILTYLFENFSYNTIVQDQVIKNADINGKPGALTLAIAELGKAEAVSQVTDNMRMLSNYPINNLHNRYFGGEIEYVLYGNSSMNKNVTYTKASIYALRFGFNCVFAFTDSTIRTMTMSAGLSVQAATLGVVPYQLVQIVLQLALAAAESAIDLQMMNNGLKVAVIKSKQTWAMSLQNVTANAKAIANVAVTELTETAQNAIQNVTNGLQNLVDAGVDELNGAIQDLQSSLPAAAQNAAYEIVDAATSHIIEALEDKINQLQYMEMESKEQVKSFLKSALDDVKANLSAELNDLFPGNEVASKMIPKIISALDAPGKDGSSPWSNMENKLLGLIDNIDLTGEASDLTSQVISKITEMKITLVNSVADIAQTATGYVAGVAFEATEGIREQLNGYIGQAGEQLSEEAAKAIKDSVTEITNSFLDTTLNAGENVIGGSLDNLNGSATSSVSSIISFGYKDYLMLFCFIQICATPDTTLTRMADLIQVNIAHASTTDGATYKHPNYSGDRTTPFQMKHAWTYLTVSTSVELEMLFMNLDLFANIVADDTTKVDGAFSQNAKITYNGLLGY